MPYTTLALGLTLTIPTTGTKNWGPTLLNTTWTKISNHTHTGSGDGAKLGTNSLSDAVITSAKLAANIALTQKAATLTPAGTVQTLNWNEGNIQILDLGSASGDVTLTLSNPQKGAKYRIHVIQAATPRDLIWPANTRWPQGQKPILSQVNDAVDVVELYYDGTDYFGDWDLDYKV